MENGARGVPHGLRARKLGAQGSNASQTTLFQELRCFTPVSTGEGENE